jgi:hypothetical protein
MKCKVSKKTRSGFYSENWERDHMPRKIALPVALLAIIMISFSAPSTAATITSAEFVIGLNQYFVNNQAPGISMDAAPYIDPDSGRTLVPVRYLADALGAGTNWDGSAQSVTVTDNSTTIAMVIGSTALVVNGQTQTMDQAPVIQNGRTYLPARWVAEALGYNVNWDAANKIVIIYPQGSIGQPPDNNVIQQAQQNAAKPAAVQKLESALGIAMITGDGNEWYYNPEMNPDGSPNIAWEKQNMTDSFVIADVGSDGSVGVSVECVTLQGNPGLVTPDLSPLQKALETIFPGADISQAMAYAQQCAANEQAKGGFPTLPAEKLNIGGNTVFVGQGNDGTTYAEISIVGG